MGPRRDLAVIVDLDRHHASLGGVGGAPHPLGGLDQAEVPYADARPAQATLEGVQNLAQPGPERLGDGVGPFLAAGLRAVAVPGEGDRGQRKAVGPVPQARACQREGKAFDRAVRVGRDAALPLLEADGLLVPARRVTVQHHCRQRVGHRGRGVGQQRRVDLVCRLARTFAVRPEGPQVLAVHHRRGGADQILRTGACLGRLAQCQRVLGTVLVEVPRQLFRLVDV